MGLHIHVHHHDTDLNRLCDSIHLLIKKIQKMANELQDLQAEVSETNGIMNSAKALIEGFSAKLQEAINANNPQALVDLKNELDTNSSGLAAAIAANPLPGESAEPGDDDNGGTEPTPGL